MIPQFSNDKRRLVPRWRSLDLTVSSRELDAPVIGNKAGNGAIPKDLLSKLATWRLDQNIISAGELVESSLVEARESESISAARFLLGPKSTATPPLQRLASMALERAGIKPDIPNQPLDDIRPLKKIWRDRTRQYPHNPLAWVELSLLDTGSGRKDEALRSMQVALQLAPYNRHVLRSAVRLFLHIHDPERAYQLLARNERTRHDPWLISAELSISDLAGKNPKYYRQGDQLISSGSLFPRQFTELAGALATLELVGGKRKRARDYFAKSMIDPNGNALAQAEWASPRFGTELVSDSTVSRVSDADEAVACHAARMGNMAAVTNACERWSHIEPYSLRPWEMGAMTSSVTGDFETSLRFVIGGLKLRPGSKELLNTKAFCLASMGKLEDASQLLLGFTPGDGTQWLVSEANRGLIEMRSGNLEEGLLHYKTSIEGFQKDNNAELLYVAQLYMYREAARVGIKEVEPELKKLKTILKAQKLGLYNHVVMEAETFLSSPPPIQSYDVGPKIKANLQHHSWPLLPPK